MKYFIHKTSSIKTQQFIGYPIQYFSINQIGKQKLEGKIFMHFMNIFKDQL